MNDLNQIITELFSSKLFYYLKVLAIFLIAAIWLFCVSYVIKDSQKRIRDKFTKILLAILAVLSGPIGLFIHMMLRPVETLDELNQRRLEKVLFLKEFETNLCPFCSAVVEKDYQFCPFCSKQILRQCPTCGNSVKIHFKTCPYCGAKKENFS